MGDAVEISTGEGHAYLATPIDGEVGGTAIPAANGESSQSPKVVLPENVRKMLRERLGHRYHVPGLGAPKD